MMFVFRATIVTLGFFGVFYCLLSLLMVCVWRSAALLYRNSAIRSARLLFAFRIFPLLGSAVVTLAFALPAFVLLEGGMDEDMGTMLFGVGTLLLFAAGLFRMLTAQADASRAVAKWLEGARDLDADVAALKLHTRIGLPPLLLYGVSTPKVLISEKAVALLSADEMRAAVRHEIGHVRSRDNLKKLIIYGLPFPGMTSLERSWQEAAEFAADEAAVSNSEDAIELAAALIKLSDLVPVQDPPIFTTGLVNIRALVKLRVERLLAWDESSSRAAQLRWWCLLPLVLATVPYTVAHYGQALLFTHRVTEWLIH
jgi:Zn-dependent protease with chaperone function